MTTVALRKGLHMNHETCPMLYTCSRVRMTPLIRVLLHCTAAEAMKSICANCEEWQEESENHVRVSAENERDHTFMSPTGQIVMVVPGGKSRREDTND